jgi:hypothetical protein
VCIGVGYVEVDVDVDVDEKVDVEGAFIHGLRA